MRSRERLADVLRSVNGQAPGIWQFQVEFLREAAGALESCLPLTSVQAQELRIMSQTHSSPHIRELAGEALYYGRALEDIAAKIAHDRGIPP